MAGTHDFSGWSEDQLRHYFLTGEEPSAAAAPQAPVPSAPVVNAPAGQLMPALEQRKSEMEARAPTGSFGEGLYRGAASVPFGAARLAGVEGAEDVAKQHGAEMERIRGTPFGALGSTAANVLTGVGLMPARGYLASMGAGAGLEALQDLGEGKSGVEGAMRGAAGGFLGNWLANTIGTVGNVGWKALGGKGRWDNAALEYVYDFGKSKGVDLRPGDVGNRLQRGFENMHVGSLGNAGVETQAGQLYKALFGDGTKNEITAGLGRVDQVMRNARNALWDTVSTLPDKTTVSPTSLLTGVEELVGKYPKLLRAMDNAQVKGQLTKLLSDKQALIKQGYSPAAAHRMSVHNNQMTFDDVREILINLNPEIAKVKGQAAKSDIVKDAYVAIGDLKNRVNADLKRWGTQNPQKYQQYQQVLDTHKKEFLPYETNPYIVKWKAGEYDEKGPEALVADLLDPKKKTLRNQLLDRYVGPIDHDAAGYMHLLDVADRGGQVIARGAAEPGGGIPSMLSPAFTAARMGAHAAAGKRGLTPITGASTRIFSTQPGALSRAGEAGIRGGLGLSWQELEGLR